MDDMTIWISVRHRALFVVIGLSVIASLFYAWSQAWVVTLDDIVKILALGVGVATSIYAAMTLNLIYITHQQTVDLKREELSARLIQRYLDKEMVAKLQMIDPLIKEFENLGDNQILERLSADIAQRHACLSLLNFFEIGGRNTIWTS